MIFVSGKIHTSLTEAAYRVRMEEEFRGINKGRKVECSECGMVLAVGSLAAHQASQHDIYQSFVVEEKGQGAPPPLRRWDARYYPDEGYYRCPVPDCPQWQEGKGVRDSYNLRWHVSYHHPQDIVMVGGVCLPKCRLCSVQVSTVGMPTHENSKTCKQMAAMRRQHAMAAQGKADLEEIFTAYGDELKHVRQFKYLGRIMSHDDNDTPAMRRNLKRARRVWGQFWRALEKEEVPPRIAGMFYQAVVAFILIY